MNCARSPSSKIAGVGGGCLVLWFTACGGGGVRTVDGRPSMPRRPPVQGVSGQRQSLALEDGQQLEVIIPEGALAAPIDLSLAPAPRSGQPVLGAVWDIGPSGTRFNTPVTVAITLPPRYLPIVAASRPVVATRNGDEWIPLDDPETSGSGSTFTGQTTHFSEFAVVEAAEGVSSRVVGVATSALDAGGVSLDVSTPFDGYLAVDSRVVQYVISHTGLSAERVDVRLAGLRPRAHVYLYTNTHRTLSEYDVGDDGVLDYVQELPDGRALIWLQARHGTVLIDAGAGGGDCARVGTWEAATASCHLSSSGPDVANGTVSEEIEIISSGTTLDCHGLTINGGYGAHAVLVGPGGNSPTIRNCRTVGSSYGIEVWDVSHAVITACDTNDHTVAIELIGFEHTVAGNAIHMPTANVYPYAVDMYGCEGCVVSGNTISGGTSGGWAIYANNDGPVVIENNDIHAPYGVLLSNWTPGSSPTLFRNNRFSCDRFGPFYWAGSGVYDVGGDGPVEISNNIFVCPDASNHWCLYALEIRGSGPRQINNNQIVGFRRGISMDIKPTDVTTRVFLNDLVGSLEFGFFRSFYASGAFRIWDTNRASPTFQKGNFWDHACDTTPSYFLPGVDSDIPDSHDDFAFGVPVAALSPAAVPIPPGCSPDGDGDGYLVADDCNDTDPNNWVSCSRCVDADGDGYFVGCDAYVSKQGPDCDDTNAAIHPGAAEHCNGVDDNCDGQVDEGFPDKGAFCSVGIGACARQGVKVCSADGFSTVCDATPGTPGPEMCDDIDHDCDGDPHNGVCGRVAFVLASPVPGSAAALYYIMPPVDVPDAGLTIVVQIPSGATDPRVYIAPKGPDAEVRAARLTVTDMIVAQTFTPGRGISAPLAEGLQTIQFSPAPGAQRIGGEQMWVVDAGAACKLGSARVPTNDCWGGDCSSLGHWTQSVPVAALSPQGVSYLDVERLSPWRPDTTLTVDVPTTGVRVVGVTDLIGARKSVFVPLDLGDASFLTVVVTGPARTAFGIDVVDVGRDPPQATLQSPVDAQVVVGTIVTVAGYSHDPGASVKVNGISVSVGSTGRFQTDVAIGAEWTCIDVDIADQCGRVSRAHPCVWRVCTPELCDGIDNNCDGQIDEGLDRDRDGFTVCGTRPGGGTDSTFVDCDDTSETGATCHNTCRTFYRDADADGHGDPSSWVSRCSAPTGHVADNTDCDDSNTNAWSSCTTCLDPDSDGDYTRCDRYLGINGPDNCPTANNPDQADADLDGVGDDCDMLGTVDTSSDPNSYSGAVEICDGIDNDGNGQIDEGTGCEVCL
jgi:hypothetical protein